MFLFQFLLVVQAIVAAALVGVILVQKSEGGGLGMGGGSPSGLMSARGAADFLTRSTSVLGGVFILLSITLAVLAAQGRSTKIDTSLARPAPAGNQLPGTPQPGADGDNPFASGARSAAAPTGNAAAPAPSDNGAVPLAQ